MANEQSSPSPAINTTPTSPPSLTLPPKTHSFTIPDTTVPIPVSSSSTVAFTPPSNPVSLPSIANPTSPPFSDQTKSATPQASEVSKEDPDQYLNSSVLDLVAPMESPEKEAAQNIMAFTAESLMNEGASPLPKS
uniref:Classical arabinogalactan protein 9-like n=1 Tax=Nicotiana sylvestris TaxID=4096 RepID=A0A1U7X1R0_NICSY|nr:PREDICTED: classical arabinogalactan protein 9-like [Nicotiana sylvestris]